MSATEPMIMPQRIGCAQVIRFMGEQGAEQNGDDRIDIGVGRHFLPDRNGAAAKSKRYNRRSLRLTRR